MRTLTRELRDALTPLMALDVLRKGNERFVNNLKANRNLLQQVNETSDGQHPLAIVLSCIDSRTSAELIFDQGLGDIFSCRVAGNVLNDDILGSMEFACKLAGAKVVLVMGHTACGAIKGAIDNVVLGNLTLLLARFKSAIDATVYSGDRSSKNAAFVDAVARTHVQQSVKLVRERSPVLAGLEAKGSIKIVASMYDLASGKVTLV